MRALFDNRRLIPLTGIAVGVPVGVVTGLWPIATLLTLAAITTAWLILSRVHAVLLALVVALPWEDLLAYPTEQITVVKLLGLLLFAAWALRAAATGEEVSLAPPLLPLSLLLVAFGVSFIFSPDPSDGLVTLMRYGLFALFFFLVLQVPRTRSDVRTILMFLTSSSAAAAAWALFQFLTVGDIDRASGPIRDANDFGYVLAAVVPVGVYLLARRGGRRWVWALAVVLLLSGVLATFSRGALVGLAAVLLWALITRRIPLTGALLGAGTTLAVVILAFTFWAPALESRLEQKSNIASRNVGAREALWSAALRMAADRPLTGVGLGRFGEESAVYLRNMPIALEDPVTHNAYLDVLAESGVFALAAFVGFLASIWRLLARTRAACQRNGDAEGGRLVSALQASLLVAIVSGSFISAQVIMPFWFFGAISIVVATDFLGEPRTARLPVTAPRRLAVPA